MASTTMGAASKAKRDSAQDRRGPQNPNRQRQPKRMGLASAMFSAVGTLLNSVFKGPDKGAP